MDRKMKKLYNLLLVSLTLIFAASCAKEAPQNAESVSPAPEDPVVDDKVPMTFEAVQEEFDGVKSDISGNFILWESTDKIAIFDGADFNEFTVSSISQDGKSAAFAGSAAASTGYVAVAPQAAATNKSVENQRVSVTITGSQTVTAGHCVATDALASTAVTDGNKGLNFTNQFALMKVTLERDDVVGISLSGNNDESISGTNHYYYGGEGAPRMDLTNAGGKTISLVYTDAENVRAAFPAGDYYIVLWPTVFTQGFKLVMTSMDGGRSVKSVSSEQTFARNGGLNMARVDDRAFCPTTITTADQLKMWRRLAEDYVEGDEVKLGADIDLGGYAWTPVPQFCGTFDGQGHKIYNFTISSEDEKVGFIAQLGTSSGDQAAVLKNVVFGSSNGSSSDGASSISATGSGSRYLGIVGYARANTVVENVTSFVPVNMNNGRNKHYVGGIVGSLGSTAYIRGCSYRGVVTDNAAVDEFGGSCLGGILGNHSSTDSYVTGCSNYGTVVNYCKDVAYIGGVVGFSLGTRAIVENCTNAGPVTNSADSRQELNSDNTSKIGGQWQICLGGVVGCIGNAQVIKCSNSAEIVQNVTIEEGSAYDKLDPDEDTRPAIGGIVGVACRTGAVIKGCTNSGRPRFESQKQYCAALGGILGAASNAGKTCTVLVTRADDGTLTVNNADIEEKNSRGDQTDYSCYMGGIVGIGSSSNLTVSFCENNGNIMTSQSQNQGTFRAGGICGMVYVSTVTDCVNNGYLQIHGGGTGVTAQCGGICGGSYGDYAKLIARCTNNGECGLYKVKNGSTLGGILSEWNPAQTDVTDCVSNGKITTGNMNSYPTDRNAQTVQDVEFGGLFGRVRSNNKSQAKACTGCIVNCEMLLNGENRKYKGLLFGRHYDNIKVTLGSDASPVYITTSCRILEGANLNPENPTIRTIAALADSYPYIQGKSCRAYDPDNGTSNPDILELHLDLGSSVLAGISD